MSPLWRTPEPDDPPEMPKRRAEASDHYFEIEVSPMILRGLLAHFVRSKTLGPAVTGDIIKALRRARRIENTRADLRLVTLDWAEFERRGRARRTSPGDTLYDWDHVEPPPDEAA